MSGTRRPALLDDWDELTRSTRRPPIGARVTSRISTPVGGVLIVSLVLAVVALQGLNALGPRGLGGTPNVSFGPDAGRADWWLDPADLPLKPDTRAVRAFLLEQACASGQSPEGRILGPRIEYRVDEVIVTFRVREIGGRCPSNPSYPVTIALDEPLGSRVLIDGGSGREAAIDPATEPTAECGPLVGPDEAKVACMSLIRAALGDRYTEFETASVAPLEGSCGSDVCAGKAEIEAITWRVDGTDRAGIASAWSCTYREKVAACGPLGHPTSSIALPTVVCPVLGATACPDAIQLVQAAFPREVAEARATVVADVCDPQVLCDRVFPFDSLVVVVPSARGATLLAVQVVGSVGPEGVLGLWAFPLPPPHPSPDTGRVGVPHSLAHSSHEAPRSGDIRQH